MKRNEWQMINETGEDLDAPIWLKLAWNIRCPHCGYDHSHHDSSECAQCGELMPRGRVEAGQDGAF